MNHTTSLEVSKEMEKLGFEQNDGEYYWIGKDLISSHRGILDSTWNFCDKTRAYLFTELLVMIQDDLDTSLFFQDNPCDAIAKLLITLKKEGRL